MAMTDEEKRQQKNYRNMLKRNHFCRECLRQDAFTFAGRVYCAECTEKRKKQRREKSTAYTRQKDNELHKAIRDKRREEHKCTRCGKLLEPSDSHAVCKSCRGKYLRAELRYKEKQRKLLDKNYPRGENGICWQCNKEEAMAGSRLCRNCYIKAVESAAIARQHISIQNHTWRKLSNNLGGNYART